MLRLDATAFTAFFAESEAGLLTRYSHPRDASGALGSLQQLWLQGNQIGDAGMIAFAEALKPNSNFPMGSLASLTRLDLSINQIGDEGMKAFSTALSSGSMGKLTV